MKNDLKNSNRTRDDSDWRELAAQTRAQRRAKGMSEPPVDVEKVAAEWAAEREAASKPAHWNKILLSLEEAYEMLKRATFIIRLGKEKDQQGEEYYTWGTGFFFTPELALTTDHNPRPYPGEKSFLAYYQGSEIQFEWVESWSFYFSKLNSVIIFSEIIYRKVFLQQIDFCCVKVPLKT